MSQWNTGYTYNNQYQDPNTWNGDSNGQYVNQETAYYPNRQFEPSRQYVSFNEFLSQMQTNGTVQPDSNNFNNPQYQNYTVNQFSNYAGTPSTLQNNPQGDAYNYGATSSTSVPNSLDMYQTNMQGQYSSAPETHGDVALTSNLTATATEFIPKNYGPIKPSPSNTMVNKQSEPSSNHKVHSFNSSSETNWRDRPSSSVQKNHRYQQNGSKHKNIDGSHVEDSSCNNYDTNSRRQGSSYDNTEPSANNYSYNREGVNNESSSNDVDAAHRADSSRNYDSRYSRNQESSSRNQNSNYRSKESRNQDSGYREPRTQDSGYKEPRNQDSNYREPRNQDSTYRSSENGSKYDRNQESSSKYYDNRNQSKPNNKNRKQEPISGGTFYNSSVDKRSQDVRNGKEGSSNRNKTWAGSQRVRPERHITDDEQFANNYLQYKEEKSDKGKVQGGSSPVKSKTKYVATDHAANTELTQRERLSEQLDKGTLECLVCCERVKQTDSVWSCGNCYHVLHLRCIRKWAMSSIIEGKWRCPACQNQSSTVPTEYRCMCGAVRNPEWQRSGGGGGGGGSGAHTCGRACKRPRLCVHPCTLLCHPGPCPPCQATVYKQCGCGAETRSVLCSSKLAQICGGVCRRKLNCTVHECGEQCHEGDCAECAQTVTQTCHCPAAKQQTVPCTAATAAACGWACGDTCGRVLPCGAHVCRMPCHAPPCQPCLLEPAAVKACPCGKTKLEEGLRKKCTDPIPLCGNICAKALPCGPAGDRHFCKLECHEGPCPVCPDKTLLPCRCNHSSREVPCADLPTMINNVFCQKKCNKKLSCGRHRCRELCCAGQSHRCGITCSRTLSCQLHRCEEFCHTGHCPPCPRVSFEELSCRCGAATLLPPVRCGAPLPPCTAPCTIPRPCAHPALHACHAAACPPCVVLTTRRCHGGHEERKTIPCSQGDFSCGLPCGKALPCGKHTCIQTCHRGACDTAPCTQPCQEPRTCGHRCGAPCHHTAPSPCPAPAPCRRPVQAVCACERRTAPRPCTENTAAHNKIISALAASKMQEGGSVDLSELTRTGSNLKTLECDDECRMQQRSRQLALALQLRNPELSAKLAPRYPEHVRALAQRDPAFAAHVHDKLTELVQRAKKSKQKTRSHSFPSMNWQKRQFIHELCEHFGCESVAYDAEPNRNVVATADKEKSWLPAMSVQEVLSREAGKRRVPGPVLRQAAAAPPASAAAAAAAAPAANKSTSGWATLTSTNAWAARAQPKKTPSEPKIDYFDNPPE